MTDSTNSPESVEELQKEVEKWKTFSRTWETRAKEAERLSEEAKASENTKKLEEIQGKKSLNAEEVKHIIQAEREKMQRDLAIYTAKKELSEVAAQAGLGEISEFIDMEKFVDDNGNVSADRLTEFVKTLTQASTKPSWGFGAGKQKRNDDGHT